MTSQRNAGILVAVAVCLTPLPASGMVGRVALSSCVYPLHDFFRAYSYSHAWFHLSKFRFSRLPGGTDRVNNVRADEIASTQRLGKVASLLLTQIIHFPQPASLPRLSAPLPVFSEIPLQSWLFSQ